MWFEVGIEGRNPMDQEEEDWGGTMEFGFVDKKFPHEVEEYFLPYYSDFSLYTPEHGWAGIIFHLSILGATKLSIHYYLTIN